MLVSCTACATDRIGSPGADSGPIAARSGVGLGSVPGLGPEALSESAARLTRALLEVCACADTATAAAGTLALCGYPIKIEVLTTPEASTNGRRIRITTGMLRLFAHEDELAFVLAHEVSHLLLGHAGAFGDASPRPVEVEADRLGIQIVSQARYDTVIAARFPARLAALHPHSNRSHGGYATPAQRSELIRAALTSGSGRRLFAGLESGCAD